MRLNFIPIQTARISPPQNKEDLYSFMMDYLPEKIEEKSIIFVTSKILSLFENRIVSFENEVEKEMYAKKLGFGSWKRKELGYPLMVVTEGGILAWGGIDESNIGVTKYILPPEDSFRSAQEILIFLKKEKHVSELGIVITDSRSSFLRKGSLGISLAWAGFAPIKNYVGQEDLFGRELRYTSQNIVDALTATAVLLMGEGNESIPMVLAEGCEDMVFSESISNKNDVFLKKEDDIFMDAFLPEIWKNPIG